MIRCVILCHNQNRDPRRTQKYANIAEDRHEGFVGEFRVLDIIALILVEHALQQLRISKYNPRLKTRGSAIE